VFLKILKSLIEIYTNTYFKRERYSRVPRISDTPYLANKSKSEMEIVAKVLFQRLHTNSSYFKNG